MDPTDENDDVLRQNRSREKQFMFDLALDGQTTQVRLRLRYFLPRDAMHKRDRTYAVVRAMSVCHVC